ncbi:MAG TPA: tripartite tricarboxylate transporter substrate-binding protein, partial [bacterium]|nr:tripartite tricarboxylate transporter substrate-binding protein [bacterium]
AGGVEMVSCSVPEAQSLLDAGRIRCLAVMSEERLSSIPDVPTLQELDIPWTARTWRGLAAPEDMPDHKFQVLVSAARDVVTSPEYKNFLHQAGFGYAALPPAEFEQTLQEEDEQYGEIFRSEAFRSVRTQEYGPMLVPTILFVLLGLTLLGLLITGNLRLPDDAQELTKDGLIRVGLTIGAVVLYLILAESIGYIFTMAILLGMLFWWFRVKWYAAVPVILVLVPLTYQLFAIYLRVPLPWGWLGW